MKLLVIGANGQLGTDLVKVFKAAGDDVVGVTHANLDVCDPVAVEQFLAAVKFDVVINTSAFHKVEECETNPQRAFEVNAFAVLNLAKACKRHSAVLVHFSTDYVFGGDKRTPYLETDLPHPLNVYGASKVAGEHLVASATERHFTVRTSGLFGVAGSSGKGGNFVETMLRKAREGGTVRVVRDQVLTPTYTRDLAAAVNRLIRTEAYGLYHISAEGECSWYDFARKIFELSGLSVELLPVSTSEFPSSVMRPAYCALSKQRLRTLGIAIPKWDEGLKAYLEARADGRKS